MTVAAAQTWLPVAGPGVRDAQPAIERLLGFTAETFLASSLMLQGAASFASRQVSRVQRCQLLMDGLGLGEYDAYKGLAEADRKKRERDAQVLAVRLEQADQELATLPETRESAIGAADLARQIERMLWEDEQSLEALLVEQHELEQRASLRRAAEAEHAQAEAERRRLREQAEAADAARESIRATEDRLAELATVERAAAIEEEYAEARAAYDRRLFERQVLHARLVELEEREVCPTCKRPFDDHDALVAERVKVQGELAALGVAVAPDGTEARRARDELAERARLEARIEAWQQTVDAWANQDGQLLLDFADIAVFDAEDRLKELPPLDQAQLDHLKQQTLEARAGVNEQRGRLDAARQDKARLEAQLERLQQVEQQARADREAHAEATRRAALALRMERLYGRDGIPAHIIENVAAPYLEAEATRILASLGLRWRVEIHVQAENKNGTVRPALDVVVVKENGVIQPYALASGGEDTRIARALQVAFARLFKHRSGAHSELFALDEPPYLDAAGLAAFVALLQDLAREFTCVQLVSHDTDLRDAFENRVEIIRENGRSRITTPTSGGYAPERPAVTA